MLPRLYTRPLVTGAGPHCPCGCALSPATSLGFSLIEFSDLLGIELLPWQRWLAVHAFETVPDGVTPISRTFRYRTVLIMVARQNGKTTWVEIKNLWKMFVLQVPLIVGTAQNLDLAEESWAHAVEIAEGVDELAEEIADVVKGAGKKALVLNNGARWIMKAATRGGGRGLSGDDVNLDELREHRKWEAWGAITKTTLARKKAQIFAFSNAGDDGSVVLNAVQENARAVAKALLEDPDAEGIDTTLGLFEWSVPDDVKCTCRRTGAHPHKTDCQLSDRALWAQANPSLGYTITEQALASALATDPEAIFRTECLCQRVPDLNKAVIDAEVWATLADVDSRPDTSAITFAVDVSPDGSWASIASYSGPGGEPGHLEIVDHREGTSWLPARLATLKERYNPIAITLDARSPAGQLLVALDALGITSQRIRVEEKWSSELGALEKYDQWDRGGLYIPQTTEVCAGCGQLVEAVSRGTFRHPGQLPMTTAISGAKARTVGDSWAWGRRLASVDISPLVAATLARYAHVKLSPKLAADDDYDVLSSVL